MKHILYAALLICMYLIPAEMSAQALWLRYPAISPDGTQIAFEYKGDIYLVSTNGGEATQLTSHTAYDYMPVWSPDGKTIAFASDRHGNFDVFAINLKGGEAQRLTFFSMPETPSSFSSDGRLIYFNATIQDLPGNYQFPSGLLSELYSVPLAGGEIAQVLSTPAENAQFNKAGNKIFYHDRKGYEDAFRKHQTSSVARDLWVYDVSTKKHNKLTAFAGEDRNPLLSADEKYMFFLTEQYGATMNVARFPLDKPGEVEQLTKFTNHPVRSLSMDRNGLCAFSYNGELYTLKVGAEPQKLAVVIKRDESKNMIERMFLNSEATEIAVSPNGKEVALIARGEVYVTLVDDNITKRITNTPEQERNISFSPDGKAVLYSSERNNSWNIYQTKINRSEEKYFAFATLLEEEVIVATEAEEFQPEYSPDGKEVAFLEERTTLRVINLASKQVRTVLDGKHNYSYSDGDQYYQWSPDGKWFLVNFVTDQLFSSEVGLVDAQGNQNIKNLTESGYNDNGPKWSMHGKAIIWFSDREGMRSHGSWGSMFDVYGMFLTQEVYDQFKMTKSETELLAEKSGPEKKTEEGDPKAKGKEKEETKSAEPAVKAVTIDWVGLEDRVERLTINSSGLGDAVLTAKVDKLYYLTRFEKGFNLWERDFKENTTKEIVKLDAMGSNLIMDKDEKNLYLLSHGRIIKVELAGKKQSSISYQAEFTYNYFAEKQYIYEHTWRQVLKKFYDPKLHGTNWNLYKDNYARFLPHINNNYDYAEMLSEMLGELNASHTGCRYSPNAGISADQTASLGLLYDWSFTGKGMKIAEVLDKSPVLNAKSKIKADVIIEKINGETIENNNQFYTLLNNQAGNRVLLSLYDGKNRWDEVVKPISYGLHNQLMYERWVKIMRAETERLSNGQLGYVHVRGMNDASFRDVYSDLFGRYTTKKAIIIDTRFNGGGWLHDDLAVLFSGKRYVTYAPRGVEMGYDPMSRWTKPSILLMSESNYSDAHAFPYAYATLGIGKTVGMPVPGTMTAVWWERQIDPTLVFGIPQVGSKDINGKYLENQQLEPDYKVMQDYDLVINKRDQQLEKAVELLLQQVK